MEYKIAIKISELMAGKSDWYKRKKERQLEDNKDGGLTAFVLISGTPDNLKIKYDKKSVKEKLKEEGKKERKEFFKNLREDLNGTDSTNVDKSKPVWDE